MSFASRRIMFLDCQTTGMSPASSHLLEIAWETDAGGGRSFLLRLPEGAGIPPRVQAITGISESDLAEAEEPEIVLRALETDLESLGESGMVLAHYARFERLFLEKLFLSLRGKGALAPRLLCTHKIACLLYPEVPSRNIRALTGYFGLGEAGIRRAAEHASATASIWARMREDLRARGLGSFEELEHWLEGARREAPAKVSYRMDRLKRLTLPDAPGVYRMLSQGGQVLYVGKATSLRSRVNSYFRGRKGRERRKLEMLAQVWDLRVTECGSPLEAALLENEEIKRLDPPYNVSLKAGRRKLVFYSRDFREKGDAQDDHFPLGPFMVASGVELVVAWTEGTAGGMPARVLFEPVSEETATAACAVLAARHGLDHSHVPAPRTLLAVGMRLLRARRKLEAEDKESEDAGDREEEGREAEVAEAEVSLSAEEVADRYEGLLVRAAGEIARARRLTCLLDAKVSLGTKDGRSLSVRSGRVWGEGDPSPARDGWPWSGLDIVDYDRISVLHAEVARCAYAVESLRGP